MRFTAFEIYTRLANVSGASFKRSEICVVLGRLRMRVNDWER